MSHVVALDSLSVFVEEQGLLLHQLQLLQQSLRAGMMFELLPCCCCLLLLLLLLLLAAAAIGR
jgi:hypothetical protein